MVVLTLVLGMAIVANAGFKLVGIPEGPVNVGDNIRISVFNDDPVAGGFAGGVGIVLDGGPGSWTGNWGTPGMPDPMGTNNFAEYFGDVADILSQPWDVYWMDLTEVSTDLFNPQEWFWADIQFNGPGIVNIVLADYSVETLETAAINVIPEPATMLLLGLGGLLLRRK